mmetsp:Transcript_24714/g.42076  ORF Transcript_24714/g.42076 Transcript_24714/m.42076 type:complete len:104 (+) Transcript_24714:87-398(+)
MKLSVASLVVLLSVGGVAASQDLLLRGSKTSDRQLKNPKCKNSLFANSCAFGGDGTCQQCCECECDGTTVEKAKEKCSESCNGDEVTAVGGDCASTCAGVCVR